MTSQKNTFGGALRTVTSQKLNRRVFEPPIFTRMVPRQAPTQIVKNIEITENRILRTPVSKTITELQDVVTHTVKNINTHMPVIHKRIQNKFNIEDVKRKNIVHHYVEPIETRDLGTKKGEERVAPTEHTLHAYPRFWGAAAQTTKRAPPQKIKKMEKEFAQEEEKEFVQEEEMLDIQPSDFDDIVSVFDAATDVNMDEGEVGIGADEVELEDSEAEGIDFGANFWKVLFGESCGKCRQMMIAVVQPVCVCVTGFGQQTGEGACDMMSKPSQFACNKCE
jgi:hypothetical protein